MIPTKAEHRLIEHIRETTINYRQALTAVRQLIDGSQPKDLTGALMVIDHALGPQAADKLLNSKPALFLSSR